MCVPPPRHGTWVRWDSSSHSSTVAFVQYLYLGFARWGVDRVATTTAGNVTQTAISTAVYTWGSGYTPAVTMYPPASTFNRTYTISGNLVRN